MSARAGRSSWRHGLAAIAALAILTAALPAAAAAAPEELLRFPEGPPGSGAGQLWGPNGIGVNTETGHLYVADSNNGRISEFKSDGTFVKAWGWGVVASGPGNKPQDERQRLVISASEGSFSLLFEKPIENDGASRRQWTAAIPFDATPAAVQAALEALPSPEPGDIVVSGVPGDMTIDFAGRFTDTDIAPLVVTAPPSKTDPPLVGSATVSTLQEGANYEICDPAVGDTCRAGQPLGYVRTGEMPAGQIPAPSGLAVDAAGDVYVFEKRDGGGGDPSARVQKFSPEGEFLWMIGGEVNKTTGANLCTKADLEAGDECGRGVPGSEDGQFNIEFGAPGPGDLLAIGPAGTLFVGDKERIQEFSTDGQYLGEVAVPGEIVRNVTIDAAGNFYLVYVVPAGGTINTKENVRKLSPAGTPIAPTFPVDGPLAVALYPAGTVYAIEDPYPFGGAAVESRVVSFDAAGNRLIPTEDEAAKKEFFAQKSTIALIGLETLRCEGADGLGALYVSDSSGHISAYGSDPGCSEAAVREPDIESQWAVSATSESAVVKATINPRRKPATYYVEYGTEDCASAACAQQPAAPGQPLAGEGSAAAPTEEVVLSGLLPGTTYHYRFVALNSGFEVKGEDRTLTTRRVEVPNEDCANQIFRTATASALLPDCRAFEMVSPPKKGAAELASRGGVESSALLKSSPSGDAVTYVSNTAFGDAKSAPVGSQYLSEREAEGWSTENITPPDQSGNFFEGAVRGFSSDLSQSILVVEEPPLCCGATAGVENLYLRDEQSGAMQLITNVAPQLIKPGRQYCVAYAGASGDFSQLFFAATGALTPDAVEADWNLYEWSAAGGMQLVSILPGGEAAQTAQSFGAGSPGCVSGYWILHNAISADGSRAIWTAQSGLYMRIEASETIQLDAPQGGTGPAGGGVFWAASDDASKVLFTSSNSLTPGAPAGALYRYDLEAPAGEELEQISGGAVDGVVEADEDADSAYFVAKGVLAGNEGAAVDEKGNPQKAEAGENNLYRWAAGEGVRFIGQFSPVGGGGGGADDDSKNWATWPKLRIARATADGRHLAFLSVEALTGADNIAQAGPDLGKATKQVFLYDAQTHTLACPSCNPTGARPLGPSSLLGWNLPVEPPRTLSEDGGRLFFESLDALSAQDKNGVRDVYQFERAGLGDCDESSPTYNPAQAGCLALLSPGKPGASRFGSFFLDASPDGEDVFISTSQPLVGADEDERYDVYAVRVGGGLPDPVAVPDPCSGAVPCREASSTPASLPASTGAFFGPGDPVAAPCRRPRVRRGAKCLCPKPKAHNGRASAKGKGRCSKPRRPGSSRRAGR